MELLVYPTPNSPGNNWTSQSICTTHFPLPNPKAGSGAIQKALLSLDPPPTPCFLPSSMKSPSFQQSQSTCLDMAAAFLGKNLCPALSGCKSDQVRVLGPKEGAARIGSGVCPQSQALTAALPGLEGIWGSPVVARLPVGPAFVLCFCSLGSGPNSQCGAALRGLARCRALGRGLPCPWEAHIPRWRQLQLWKETNQCAKGNNGSPRQEAQLHLVSRKSSQKSQPQAPQPPPRSTVILETRTVGGQWELTAACRCHSFDSHPGLLRLSPSFSEFI